MTTTSAPFGFRPIYHPSGQIRPNTYLPGARAAAAAIYRGDPVKLVEDGTDFLVIAVAGDAIIGIFAGCEYTDINGKPTESSYWPGTVTGATNITFYVYDDPNTVFEAQASATLASSAVGDQANFIIAAGSTATGLTATQFGTLVGAGVQGDFRVVGISKRVDNAWGDTYPIVECMMARHQYVAVKVAI